MIGRKWNVMVTGGAGYVGSVLVPQLLAAGHKVTVLDLFMYGEDVFDAVRNNPDLRLIKGDIRDRSRDQRGPARQQRRDPSRLHLQRPVVRAGSGARQIHQLRLLPADGARRQEGGHQALHLRLLIQRLRHQGRGRGDRGSVLRAAHGLLEVQGDVRGQTLPTRPRPVSSPARFAPPRSAATHRGSGSTSSSTS